MRKEKVVGLLGGMGPYATLDFFRKILISTPAKKDWEHLRILIDNNVKIPSRTRAVLYNEPSPAPGMIKSINNLASIGADFVAVPCNSAHYFCDDVAPFIKISWLNIIEITSKRLIKIGCRPLILGGYVTTKKKLYSKYLPGAVYLSEVWNNFIIGVIEEIKLTSKLSQLTRKKFKKMINDYKSKIDSIILACTELSIVFKGKSICGIPLVDSSLEYAKEVVRYAKDLDKK